tara:strand:+ start:1312 stop:2430 length:1119 start_codon:yes stop_codon:yes gene_type:complete
MKRYVLIAGETSGDQYGSQLMEALKEINPKSEFWGIGGEEMIASGLNQFENIHNMSVVGFSEALKKVPTMLKLANRLSQFINEVKPDRVILIDFPGFNLSLAKKIKHLSNETKIDFFISPQIWAWNERRVKIIKKYINHMIVIFPFETSFYKKHGIKAHYVGHPYLDQWKPSTAKYLRKKLNLDSSKKIVGIFPGSRAQELKVHLPIYLKVAESLSKHKNVKCVVGLAPGFDKLKIERKFNLGNVQIIDDEPLKLLECCDVALVTSGTISLQATFMNTPCVVAYKLSRLSGYLSKLLMKVNFISMTNIVANKSIIPEFVQKEVNVKNLYFIISKLLNDDEYYKKVKLEMGSVKEIFVNKKNVIDNAARIINK